MEIPDLNDVRTFVVIAQAGTLTAAAKELRLANLYGEPVADSSRTAPQRHACAAKSPRAFFDRFWQGVPANLQEGAKSIARWKGLVGEPARAAEWTAQSGLSRDHGSPGIRAFVEGISGSLSRAAGGDRTLLFRLGSGAAGRCGCFFQTEGAQGFAPAGSAVSWHGARTFCQSGLRPGVRAPATPEDLTLIPALAPVFGG